MERDMKEWAKQKDIVEKAMHEGRRQEYEKYTQYIEDAARREAEEREWRRRAQVDLEQLWKLYEEVTKKVRRQSPACCCSRCVSLSACWSLSHSLRASA